MSARMDSSTTSPPWLRLVRLLSGMLLLAVALGGVLVERILVTNLRDGLGHLLPASFQTLTTFAFDGVVSLWLLAVVLGCLLTGAMSLWIALTRRGW
jgi:hypothetical protein